MDSAAAARFAARYGMANPSDTTPAADICPTCPTQEHDSGTHSGAVEMAVFRDLSDECPTSLTCPTHFEGVGDEKWGEHAPPGRPTVEAEAEQPPGAEPWAEGIAHLQNMPPLPGFEAGRWRLVLLDCTALLELWGSEMRRLGWKTEDGFGINPRAPGASVNCYGLGVLLKGGKVVEMTATGAKVQCLSGVHQSFVKPRGLGAVPIWTAGNQGGECARSPLHARSLL